MLCLGWESQVRLDSVGRMAEEIGCCDMAWWMDTILGQSVPRG